MYLWDYCIAWIVVDGVEYVTLHDITDAYLLLYNLLYCCDISPLLLLCYPYLGNVQIIQSSLRLRSLEEVVLLIFELASMLWYVTPGNERLFSLLFRCFVFYDYVGILWIPFYLIKSCVMLIENILMQNMNSFSAVLIKLKLRTNLKFLSVHPKKCVMYLLIIF